jgi:tyrosine-protein kinase Etk/Wzc
MSRVTDAVRKFRGAGVGAPDSSLRSAEGVAGFAGGIPWDLDDADSLIGQPDRRTERTSAHGEAVPALERIAERGLPFDESTSREQLAPIVQCLLQQDATGRRIRSLLFTAIVPEHGAGLCATAAEAVAQHTPRSVCVVDGNLHAPSLHTSFGVHGAPGLSDLLVKGGPVHGFLTRLRSNLWLLPGGTQCAEALPGLIGDQMRGRLIEVLATFDYVLLETAAVSVHNDAVALGTLVDAAVIIVGANVTRREVARRALEQLRAANVHVLGAILTNRAFPIPEPLYRRL